MKRHFTPLELQEAQKDSEKLGLLIADSCGYCLLKMQQEALMPPVEILMQCLSADSLSFLLEHYELTPSQKKEIVPYFKDPLHHETLKSSQNVESVNDALQSGKVLQKGTCLTVWQINHWQSEIDQIFKLNQGHMARILEESVHQLSWGEWLCLSTDFLKKHLYLFKAVDSQVNSKALKVQMRDLILQVCQEEGRVPTLNDFKEWKFGPSDKSFFLDLLKAQSGAQKEYYEIVQIDGASDLISPLEYCLDFNQTDINGLSHEETVKYKDRIQAVWLTEVKKEPICKGSRLVSFKASPDQFKIIFDSEFVKQLTELKLDLSVASPYAYDHAYRVKLNHFKYILLQTVLAEGWTEKESALFTPNQLIQQLQELCVADRAGGGAAEYINLMRQFTEKRLPEYLKTNSASTTDSLRPGYSDWISSKNIDSIAQLVETNPSINLLLLLIIKWKAVSDKRDSNKELLEPLSRLAKALLCHVEKKSAAKICSVLGFQRPLISFGKRVESTQDNDFLKLPYSVFSNDNEALQKLLFDFDNECVEKMKKAHVKPNKALLLHALEHSSESQEKLVQCKKIIHLDLTHALSVDGVLPAILKRENGSKILDRTQAPEYPNEWESIKDQVRQIQSAHESWEDVCQLLNALCKKREEEPSAETTGTPTAQAEAVNRLERSKSKLEELMSTHSKTISDGVDQMPFDVVSKWLDEALKKNEYNLFSALAEERNHTYQTLVKFAKHLQSMEWDELLHTLNQSDNQMGLSYQLEALSLTKLLQLNFGTVEKNRRAAEAFLKMLPQEKAHTFSFFSQSALDGFANSFAVEYFSDQIPYAYELAPTRPIKIESALYEIREPYTNEQLIQLWKKLDQGAGIFRGTHSNNGWSNLIYSNFQESEECYLQLVKQAERDPKLYCLLINKDLTRTFKEQSLKKQSLKNELPIPSDEHYHREYIQQYFNWEILVEGVGQILTEMSRRAQEQDFNPNLASGAIDQVVGTTTDRNCFRDENDPDFKSKLSVEQCAALLHEMYEKGPLYLYGLKSLGPIESVSHYLSENIAHFADDRAVEHFICAPFAHKKEGFHISEPYGEDVETILNGLLKWMCDENRQEDLEFVDWMVKLNQFNCEQLNEEAPSSKNKEWNEAYWGLINQLGENDELNKTLIRSVEKVTLHKALPMVAGINRKSRSL